MAEPKKKAAPTLYAIIVIKLLKGCTLLLLALGAYTLADKNLPEAFNDSIRWVHLDPERKFFSELGEKIETITPQNIRVVAIGTLLYSMFSLIEGVGLIFRVGWAGWLAIGESAFFVPVEIFELLREFSWVVTIILLVNVGIVWYLFRNRDRLFKH